MTLKTLFASGCLAVAFAVSADTQINGPFRGESFAFYVVHDGGPLKVEISADHNPGQGFFRGGGLPPEQTEWARRLNGKVMARFMDAEEKTVKRDYGIVSLGGKAKLVHDYKNAPAGIYQIRTAAGNADLDLRITPAKKFGVMASRCMIQASHSGQFARTYFYVPEADFKVLKLRNIGFAGRVKNSEGKTLLELSRTEDAVPEYIDAWMDTNKRFPAKNLDLSGLKGKVLSLELDMPSGRYVRFGASGMPLILCPDADTAERINASVERASDGRSFAHKFQVRAYEWMQKLNPETLKIDFRNYADFRKAFEAEPKSAALLGAWGVLGAFESIIRDQNLDKKSPKYGLTQHIVPSIVLSLNKPYNPYYGSGALRRRMLLNQFAYYLKLNENDTFEDSDDSYTGLDSFLYSYLAEAAYHGAPMLKDPEERELFCEGALHLADRFPFFHAHCENQSAHYLIGHYMLGKLPEGKIYARIAKEYAADLSDPALNPYMKTGYFQEREGLDATYVGLGACIQSVYFRDSGDRGTFAGLRRLYQLMNHTVAPEPDGSVYGSSGFAVRTAGSWAQRQWGGGSSMLRGVLPEAALWDRNAPEAKSPDWPRILQKVPDAVYRKQPHFKNYAGRIHTAYYYDYLYPAKTMKGNFLFPAEEKNDFARNFNNEFLAVKRKDVYAFFYTGKTWSPYHRDEMNLALNRPLHFRKTAPPVQGLQLAWLSGVGSAQLGMNWAIQTQPALVAELSGNKAAVPDYWTFDFSWNPEKLKMEMSWKLLGLPAEVERSVSVTDGGIVNSVTLRTEKAWECNGVYEQIPLPVKKGAVLFFRSPDGKWSSAADGKKVSAVWYGQEGKEGVMISFRDPADLSVWGPETLSTQSMLSLRIALGNKFRSGESVAIQWTLGKAKRN